MAKQAAKLYFTAPLLIALILTLVAFKTASPDKNKILYGGGFIGGNTFVNVYVTESNGAYEGHLQFGALFIEINCVRIEGNKATLYGNDKGTPVSITIIDGGSGMKSLDFISTVNYVKEKHPEKACTLQPSAHIPLQDGNIHLNAKNSK